MSHLSTLSYGQPSVLSLTLTNEPPRPPLRPGKGSPSSPQCLSRSRCPWGAAGPGRGPRHRGCGPAGEGAPSAAPGLLELGLWPAESRMKSHQHRHLIAQFSSFQRTGGHQGLLPSLAIASGDPCETGAGKVGGLPTAAHPHHPHSL